MKPLFTTWLGALSLALFLALPIAHAAAPKVSAPVESTIVGPPTQSHEKEAAAEAAPPALDYYPLSEVVTQAQNTSGKLEAFENQKVWKEFYEQLPANFGAIQLQIKDRPVTSESLVIQPPSLEVLQTEITFWQATSKKLDDWSKETNRHQNELQAYQAEFEKLSALWEKTQKQALQQDGKTEITDRMLELTTRLKQNNTAAAAYLKSSNEWQAKLAATNIQAAEMLKLLENTKTDAIRGFLNRDIPAIWDMQAFQQQKAQFLERGTGTLRDQIAELWDYSLTHLSTLWWHLGLPILFYLGLRYMGTRMDTWIKSDPTIADYRTIYEMPKSTALILSLIISLMISADAPPLFRVMWGLITLAPTVYLLHQFTERPLWHLLRALVVFYVCELVLSAIAGLPLIARGLFLLEMTGGALFCLWFLRCKLPPDFKSTLRGTFITSLVRVSLLVFVTAGFANIIGLGAFSTFLASALLKSVFVAVCLKALLNILEGLFAGLLHLPPLNLLRAIKRNRPMVRQKMESFLHFSFAVYWIYVALELLSIRKPFWQKVSTFTNNPIQLGDAHINLGSILSFLCAIIASIYVSRFVRFLLEEDLYPRVKLARGVPYAISTVLHYVILFVGFILAVAALGYDMTKFTILAGAFGVGLGFGMQNIVNNFVSGLIVLFERPIQVGDVVQIDSVSGTISRIGIRATVIRVGDGSEVVVPNGKLISDRFTNWTLSDRKKRISLFIIVKDPATPESVMKLLVQCAKDHALVSSLPSPQAYLTEFTTNSAGATGMKFELAAWTNNLDDGKKLQSELAVAIREGLTELGIELC